MADWTVTSLAPSGANYSQANSVEGNIEVGIAQFGDSFQHAISWQGSAGSWLDLMPSGGNRSWAYGISGGRIVGRAEGAWGAHAGYWTGGPATWMDLRPGSSNTSTAYGVSGSLIVGQEFVTGHAHAARWLGGTFADMHVAAFNDSSARGTDGTLAVGVGYTSLSPLRGHALMWDGARDYALTDLNPSGSLYSIGNAVSGGVQVGDVSFDGNLTRPALWTGTAASFVDLTPTGSSGGSASAVVGNVEVGFATFGNNDHAGYWKGTADSWFDLQSVMPANFTSSEAYGVALDGSTLRIVGRAWNTNTGHFEAVMWSQPVPEPATLLGLAIGGLRLLKRHHSAAR